MYGNFPKPHTGNRYKLQKDNVSPMSNKHKFRKTSNSRLLNLMLMIFLYHMIHTTSSFVKGKEIPQSRRSFPKKTFNVIMTVHSWNSKINIFKLVF